MSSATYNYPAQSYIMGAKVASPAIPQALPAQARIVIRPAAPSDWIELRRLAERDSAEILTGRVLIAEVNGAPRAAYSLSERRSVADPFHPSADLVELLRLHARSLRLRPRVHRRRSPARWSSGEVSRTVAGG